MCRHFKWCFPVVLFASLVFPVSLHAQVFNTPGSAIRAKVVDTKQSDTTVIPADTLAGVSAGAVALIQSGQPQICLPLKSMRLTSSFGWRIHPVTGSPDFHRGIDLSARTEPVYCILDGQVTACGYDHILGNYIRISHSRIESIYGHLSLTLVTHGQAVTSAQIIGVTGSTGRTTGEHLHFSIKFQGSYIHPLYFLKGMAGAD